MADPFQTLAGILTDLAKGRGVSAFGKPMSSRVGDLVKEGMTYFAEIDAEASFEWSREDLSNYTPDNANALLEELKVVWGDHFLVWIEENINIRVMNSGDHDEDTEVEWA